MSAVAEKIKCGACSRTYKWKPEFAGKKAKCKCGAKVEFPKEEPANAPPAENGEMDLAPRPDLAMREKKAAAPAAAPPPDSGEMDLAPRPDLETPKKKVEAAPATGSGACPNCKAKVAPSAVICTSCGTNLKTGKKLGTAVQKNGLSASASQAPAKAGVPMWVWVLVGTVVVVGGGLAGVFFLMPDNAENIFKYVGVGGAILFALGMWYSTYIATAGNLALRFACRFVPFLGIAVVIKQCATDWESVKNGIYTLLVGAAIAVMGFGMMVVSAMHKAQ